MVSRSSWLNVARFVPLGRYCRSSLFVFSFVPRYHGLRGKEHVDTGVGGETLVGGQFHTAVPGQHAV